MKPLSIAVCLSTVLGCSAEGRQRPAADGAPGRDLVRIPAGSYEVSDRITTLELRVSVSELLLGATEVTQREYEAMTDENPSVYKGSSRPVENVSWWDAIRFCNLRSAKEGLTPCYDVTTGRRLEPCTGYRLPTEAEWIVAAGPPPTATALDEVANLGDTSTKSLRILQDALEKGTMPVCSRTRNAHGICDLRGNVWEWSSDYYGAVASPDAVHDPVGPAWGPARVIRGGSFVTTTSRWSRDYRSSMRADSRSRYTGFRVARSLNATERRQPQSATFFEPYDDPPPAFEASIGALSPLAPEGTSVEAWQQRAGEIRAKWEALLGIPKRQTGRPAARVLRKLTQRWYLGEKLAAVPPGTDQHELIALIAPRPFLLVGGDEYDTDESWHYINAARTVYRLAGKPEHVGYLNHRAGHTPTPEAVSRAFDWLNHFLKP